MPISPLDLQVLYMQQSHIGRMEHVRMAAKTIAMQSEDRDIHRDSYIKDSTVVKSENVSEDNKIKEKKDNQKNKGYMSYRKKNKSVFNQNYDDDSQNNNIEIEEVSLTEQSKGLKIDILG